MENEAFRRCTGGNLVETPNASSIGSLQSSGVPNATGRFGKLGVYDQTIAEGVFTTKRDAGGGLPLSGSTTWSATMNLSLASPVYQDGLNEARPVNYAAYVFIAF